MMQDDDGEKLVAVVARRVAKRQNGEHYEGFESSHLAAAKDYLSAIEREGYELVKVEPDPTPEEVQQALHDTTGITGIMRG